MAASSFKVKILSVDFKNISRLCYSRITPCSFFFKETFCFLLNTDVYFVSQGHMRCSTFYKDICGGSTPVYCQTHAAPPRQCLFLYSAYNKRITLYELHPFPIPLLFNFRRYSSHALYALVFQTQCNTRVESLLSFSVALKRLT